MLQFNPGNWTKKWNTEIKSEIRVGDHEAGASFHVLPPIGMGDMSVQVNLKTERNLDIKYS